MLSRAKVEAVFFTTSASSNGPTLQAPTRLNGEQVHRVAITSLEFMSMVMVHPEVPRNSNGVGLGPRR